MKDRLASKNTKSNIKEKTSRERNFTPLHIKDKKILGTQHLFDVTLGNQETRDPADNLCPISSPIGYAQTARAEIPTNRPTNQPTGTPIKFSR